MRLHGFNKVTLLDYPGLLACTLFTGNCNLRCLFCHNASLVLRPDSEPEIAADEVLSYLKKRRGVLEGVCITGGEPTLQADLIPFIKDVKALGYQVKLDTNGTRPDVLKQLYAEHLPDYIAMDIKNSKEQYARTVGAANAPAFRLEEIEESAALLRGGEIPYEFRTTVVKEFHTKETLLAVADWLNGARCYALQAFIDSGDLISGGLHGFSKEELLAFRELLLPYFGTVLLRGV